ncbi:hypothetical protein M0R72_08565 [Candidatus Pacearchaeota archaeon]|jgi:hypothetical protein|nr:hypothetical protein [Candidatus Pacearchaeota archaeon]
MKKLFVLHPGDEIVFHLKTKEGTFAGRVITATENYVLFSYAGFSWAVEAEEIAIIGVKDKVVA